MTRNLKISLKIIAIAAFASAGIAAGCAKENMSDTTSDTKAVSETPGTQIYQAKGVVKSLDKNAGTVAISHEEIPGLMSAMTMDFEVKDAAMLDTVSPGDSVSFELERNGSDLTVNKMIRSGGNYLVDGAGVYKANCTECHGEKGAGTEKGISFLEGHALDHSREDFLKRVSDGKDERMPAFKDKLKEKEIEAVVSYVRDVIQKDAVKKDNGTHDH